MQGTLGTRRGGGNGGEGNDCTGAGIKAQLGKPDEGVKEVSRATRGRTGTRDSGNLAGGCRWPAGGESQI